MQIRVRKGYSFSLRSKVHLEGELVKVQPEDIVGQEWKVDIIPKTGKGAEEKVEAKAMDEDVILNRAVPSRKIRNK